MAQVFTDLFVSSSRPLSASNAIIRPEHQRFSHHPPEHIKSTSQKPISSSISSQHPNNKIQTPQKTLQTPKSRTKPPNF